MSYIKLSKRMHAVVDLVDEKSVADIGCDHAHVAMWLAENGVNKVIAMDVKQGPLDAAKSNISANNMEDIISVRLSDGMEALRDGEVDCAIIAGMGGELITQILRKGKKKLEHGIHLILQPQSEIHKVRQFILQNGYAISVEKMLVEDDKFYNVMKAVPKSEVYGEEGCGEIYSSLDILYGKRLLDEKNPVLETYLCNERNKLSSVRSNLEDVYTETAVHRLKEINDKLEVIEAALDIFACAKGSITDCVEVRDAL
ncbi:MAG: class I SAM-dependent methyltransferase [Lachnospiraceae bacterium]|nr:class I SAM-dependent methyltransferase [Lachnospiraceae bacterium]